MTRPRIIAISGGIGSGKSVVCKMLRIMGYDVYDCDYEAKLIMDADNVIKDRLRTEIADGIIKDGIIDRKRLAEIVFSDSEKLAALNHIVHRAVRERFAVWTKEHKGKSIVFVETAILYSSGMIEDVDAEWRVIAPEDIRIARVMKRNGISAGQVKDRIASQKAEEIGLPDLFIINDGQKAVSPQLLNALRQIITA